MLNQWTEWRASLNVYVRVHRDQKPGLHEKKKLPPLY